ncbi:MAG: c-type cytochrome domain-containing protein, partial [Bacteroidia bacterium]
MTRYLWALLGLAVGMVACGPPISDDPDILARLPQKVDFNYHIKPLLSDRCYSCHGPDENKRESGLRLDTEEGAFAALTESKGHAIVGGSLSKSAVYHRI